MHAFIETNKKILGKINTQIKVFCNLKVPKRGTTPVFGLYFHNNIVIAHVQCHLYTQCIHE
jgi:hypothetical protein